MTTIVTPLGCSRSELNSQRAGGYEGESRSRAVEEEPSGTAAPLLARRSPKRGEVIDLVYFHGKSVGDRGDRRRRRGRGSCPRRPLWTALPPRAGSGGPKGGRPTVVSFLFLGLLFFHYLLRVPSHFS